jgi:hypothetical protein
MDPLRLIGLGTLAYWAWKFVKTPFGQSLQAKAVARFQKPVSGLAGAAEDLAYEAQRIAGRGRCGEAKALVAQAASAGANGAVLAYAEDRVAEACARGVGPARLDGMRRRRRSRRKGRR